MKKLIRSILRENLQQADKHYFNNGKLSPKTREIILRITGGDNFTKLITDMYFSKVESEHKQGQWSLKTIDNDHIETDKPESDILGIDTLKELKGYHNDLVSYNKNVFPIVDFNISGVKEIGYFMSALKQRRLILEEFKKLPSIATRNMKDDIRQPRTYPDLQRYRSDLEHFIGYYSLLSNRDDQAKKKIEGKMFKSGVTLDDLLSFADDKENFVGGTKFTRNKLKEITREYSEDLDIVYDNNNIIIIEVSGPQGIKQIGCNSLWCFTYGSGFDGAWRQWNNYSTNGLVYVIIDLKESPDSKDFMYVLIKPLQDEYDEREEEDPSTLFDMSNDAQYNPNGIISHLIDFELAKKLMNFGEEPEEEPEPKEKEFKDPNQLSLFEFRKRISKIIKSNL